MHLDGSELHLHGCLGTVVAWYLEERNTHYFAYIFLRNRRKKSKCVDKRYNLYAMRTRMTYKALELWWYIESTFISKSNAKGYLNIGANYTMGPPKSNVLTKYIFGSILNTWVYRLERTIE